MKKENTIKIHKETLLKNIDINGNTHIRLSVGNKELINVDFYNIKVLKSNYLTILLPSSNSPNYKPKNKSIRMKIRKNEKSNLYSHCCFIIIGSELH